MRYTVAHSRHSTSVTLADRGSPVNGKKGESGHVDKKKKQGKQVDKPGPKPDVLKLEGDWQDLVKQALTKKMPKKSK